MLARISRDELSDLLSGYGYTPHFVEGDEPAAMHERMAATLDRVVETIQHIQTQARTGIANERPLWPMIVLRSPKGWTGPKEVDGRKQKDPGEAIRCQWGKCTRTPST